MLISPEYLESQQWLHKNKVNYGTSGQHWHGFIAPFTVFSKDVLDYGCGKRTLEKALGFQIQNYDPAIPHLAFPAPVPADIVACTDVLEHIEPDCIDAVLDDLQRLVKKVGFFTIATYPALKHFPDGRNLHVLIKPPAWWLEKLEARFMIWRMELHPTSEGNELLCTVGKKC